MSYEVLSRLLANLRASHTVYERLLEMAERKQLHIVSNEIEQLHGEPLGESILQLHKQMAP